MKCEDVMMSSDMMGMDFIDEYRTRDSDCYGPVKFRKLSVQYWVLSCSCIVFAITYSYCTKYPMYHTRKKPCLLVRITREDKKAESMDQLPALSISSSEEAETSGNDANLVSPACSGHAGSYEYDDDSDSEESLFDYPYKIVDDLSTYENYDEMVEKDAALIYELQQLNSELQVELE